MASWWVNTLWIKHTHLVDSQQQLHQYSHECSPLLVSCQTYAHTLTCNDRVKFMFTVLTISSCILWQAKPGHSQLVWLLFYWSDKCGGSVPWHASKGQSGTTYCEHTCNLVLYPYSPRMRRGVWWINRVWYTSHCGLYRCWEKREGEWSEYIAACTLQKISYFDNCICYQNYNCDVV